MLARTKQLTNLMVLISIIPKLHCTDTPITLSFYSFSGPTLYELFEGKTIKLTIIVCKNYHTCICSASFPRPITRLDLYKVKCSILDIYKCTYKNI